MCLNVGQEGLSLWDDFEQIRAEAHRITKRLEPITNDWQSPIIAAAIPADLKGITYKFFDADGNEIQSFGPDHKVSSGNWGGVPSGAGKKQCSCDIKNLMSTGHDDGCPEKP